MIGPTTKPTKRSIAVHSPPPTTWQKVSIHSELVAMAMMTKARTAPAIGMPALGTTGMSGRSPAEVAPPCSSPTAADCTILRTPALEMVFGRGTTNVAWVRQGSRHRDDAALRVTALG